MSFKIIPAIDLLDGQVVRLHRGDYARKKVYSDNPLSIAREFSDAGCTMIHVVDLNAARTGDRSVNRSVIEGIASGLQNSKIEVGGGVRSAETMREILDLGVARVIVGTRAAGSPSEIESWFQEFGAEKILIGVDVADGRIRVQGWEEDGGFGMIEFLNLLEQKGCVEIVLTNIVSDGTLEGVALDFYRAAVAASKLKIVVSGGVSGMQDVEAFAKWNHPQITGMIAGTAVYEKKLDLKAANQISSSNGIV